MSEPARHLDRGDVSRLAEVNAARPAHFVRLLGGVVEHADWVVERTEPQRPFESIDALCDALSRVISTASAAEQLALLQGHPELAGAEAIAGQMTSESTSEQDRIGLSALKAEQHAQLEAYNTAYRARHGFPYIIALWRHPTLASVFADFSMRLQRDTLEEHQTALAEVDYVVRARVHAVMSPRVPFSQHPRASSEAHNAPADKGIRP